MSTPALGHPQVILKDEFAVRAALREHWLRLQDEFGRLGLDEATFTDRIVETIRARSSTSEEAVGLPVLNLMAINDLYLAQGCALGNKRAWRLFEDLHGATLDQLSLIFATRAISAEDARQELLSALLSGRNGSGSTFSSYRGAATLKSWLRVSLRRIVIDLHRRSAWRPLAGGDLPPELAVVPDGESTASWAEPELIASQTCTAVIYLVCEALAELSTDDRDMLLRYHRDGRILADLAREVGVHTATISRRLNRIRSDVRALVLERAHERLALSPEDLLAIRDFVGEAFNLQALHETGPSA